jgi:hypothetical protein
MMLDVLFPGVKNAKKADVRTQALGVAGQFEHRCSTCAIGQVIQ